VSFSKAIFLALALGVGAGLFFGEKLAFFNVVAEAYIQLLQMTVMPYVMVSLIAGLGSLTYGEARTLLVKVGGILVALWAISLGFVFLMPLAFPGWESASFFSTALLHTRPEFDFLGLYIPANPFFSMANNIVPAVVLFSIIVGVALIGVDKKSRLIEILEVFNGALTRATRFVVKLTPVGIFAIAAYHAGTMGLGELERLQVYVIVYVVVALLLVFWVLPGLVATLTPVRYREMIGLTKDAMITAFMTGNLFIVLPILTEASRQLLEKHNALPDESRSLPDVIVPASFNFPHTGKVLTLSFILFAGWFSGSDVSIADYPKLAVTGLVTLFGNLNVSIPFLLDVFRIPADMFQLFLATSVVNSRVGTLIAAMHTLSIALLGASAISGTLRRDPSKMLRFVIVTAALVVVCIGGARIFFAHVVENDYHKDKIISGMHLMRDPMPARVQQEPPAVYPELTDDGKSVLQSIGERGVLRVGFFHRGLPYAYVNDAGELVGFDVEMANRLARELGVELEFLAIERSRLKEALDSGYCDLVMSGYVVTTERAREITVSAPYIEETLALITYDHRRYEMSEWARIREMEPFHIGVPNVPYYIDKVRTYLTHAEVTVLDDVVEFFEGRHPGIDAVLFTAERGSAWTLFHPQFSVVVPQPARNKATLAYPIARGDGEMTRFVNTWIELKKNDGTIESLFDYWIMGINAEPKKPRWSIIRDVLHWTG
jgi:Na+/H+-dicarboxylate symporter/ABC-type amino acid transport substrate-binding protein